MTEPHTTDSPAIKRALLASRAKWWRSQGMDELADRLDAEFAATTDGAPADPSKVRTLKATTPEPSHG